MASSSQSSRTAASERRREAGVVGAGCRARATKWSTPAACQRGHRSRCQSMMPWPTSAQPSSSGVLAVRGDVLDVHGGDAVRVASRSSASGSLPPRRDPAEVELQPQRRSPRRIRSSGRAVRRPSSASSKSWLCQPKPKPASRIGFPASASRWPKAAQPAASAGRCVGHQERARRPCLIPRSCAIAMARVGDHPRPCPVPMCPLVMFRPVRPAAAQAFDVVIEAAIAFDLADSRLRPASSACPSAAGSCESSRAGRRSASGVLSVAAGEGCGVKVAQGEAGPSRPLAG